MLKANDGYPASAAAAVKREWAGDYFGPGNYQQPGDVIPATSLGMAAIETTGVSARSQSGNYYVQVVLPPNSGANETRAPAYLNVTAQWYSAANNTQVANNTNLSAEVVRFSARGI